MTLFEQLSVSIAFLGLFVVAWTQLRAWLPQRSRIGKAFALGGVVGVGQVIAMSHPFALGAEVYFDLRSALIAIATFFGGPIAGTMVTAVAVAMRAALAGPGLWSGLIGIAATFAAALAVWRLARGRERTNRDIFILAAATVAVSPLGALLLPAPIRWTVLSEFLPLLGLFNIVGILVAGAALIDEQRRRRLAASNALYHAVIDALPDCLNVKDRDGRFILANPATARFMRAPGEELIGRTDFDFYPAELAAGFHAVEQECLAGGAPRAIVQPYGFADGASGVLSTLKAPFRDETGEIVGLITHNRDVTEQERLREELRRVEATLHQAVTHLDEGVVICDRHGTIQFCNERYPALFPATADLRVVGGSMADILERSELFGEETRIAAACDDAVSRLRRPGSRTIALADGRALEARTTMLADGGWITVIADVTERKAAEAALAEANRRLERLALTDGLTGLNNRRWFDQALAADLRRSRSDFAPPALLMIDVDRFKLYNDAHGHLAGDAVLRSVAAALGAASRGAGDAARYGGEEIAVLLPASGAEAARLMAETIRIAVEALAIPHSGNEGGVVTVSIGVAAALDGEGADALIGRADAALYEAKAAGRNRVRLAPPAPASRLSAAS